MTPEDKKEFLELFKQSFERIVLPTIVDIHETLEDHGARLGRIEDKLDDHGNRLDRIERKLNSVVDRQDRQSVEISALKDKPA